MIIFKYIRWKNFLSTGNTWTEVNLHKNKSSLIVGENGAGKSTILDALSYSLYAKPFRKINKNQLINSINGKGAEVEVEFSIANNNYKIIRGIKKYGSPKFEVYRNDELINQDASARDYQDVVEKNILKLNHKSFSQIVVLGSSTFVPFMQLSSQHRREVIEDLLDIQIFSTMNTLLKEKAAANKNKLMDIDYAINLAEEKISMQENYISQLKQNNEKRINDGKIKIAKAEKEKKSYSNQIVTLQENIEQLQNDKADIDKIKTKKKKLEQFEYKMQDKISKLSQEITFYGDHDDCPTCKQNIDEDFKCDIIEKKQKVLNETNDGFAQLKEEYEKVERRLVTIQGIIDQINDLQADITSHNSQINALNQLIDSINEDIQSLNVPKQSNAETDKLKELTKELKSNHEEKETLTNDKSVLDVASLILKDSGIKTRIIKQYVPIMNKLVNKYLASMDFFVQFELDENFNETIKSRYRDEFSYASFSEGEKMRIDLALLFTWRAIAKLRNSQVPIC